MNQNELKKLVGERAVEFIAPKLNSKSIVGVGTGSTANCFIDSLAKIKHQFDGTVASSMASEERLKSHQIPVYQLNDIDDMEFYVDGADEVGPGLTLIKGGGGAHTREKIVASVARQFVCIVDKSKLVETLGQFPLPIEVIPIARSSVARELVKLGGQPVYREGFLTDNGNMILDVHNLVIDAPVELERRLNNITGMVCSGLFAMKPADVTLVADETGIREVYRDS